MKINMDAIDITTQESQARLRALVAAGVMSARRWQTNTVLASEAHRAGHSDGFHRRAAERHAKEALKDA